MKNVTKNIDKKHNKNMIKLLKKYSLKNKNILITGAAGTLGKQFSLALLEVGARVIITDIDEKKLKKVKNEILKKNKKDTINDFKLDVSSENSIKDVRRSIQAVLEEKRNQFLTSSNTLEAVSPLAVLSRGYSILTKGKEEKIINSYAQVKVGDEITGKLKEGQILTKVIDVSDES